MKFLNSVFTAALFAFIFSATASAQAVSKIGFINSSVFPDDKAGITRLVNANKQIENEFRLRAKEITDGAARLQTIATELQNMEKLPPQQVNQTSYMNKQDEGARLQRELKYKEDDLKRDVAKRRDVLLTPISNDIAKALDEYAAKNAFTAVLDAAKLAENGSILYLAGVSDITKEFVVFFNARPATATTAAPK